MLYIGICDDEKGTCAELENILYIMDMRPDEYKIVENRPEYVSIKRGNRWIIIACYPD